MIDPFHPELPLHTAPKQRPGFQLEKTACCYVLRNRQTNATTKLNDTSLLIWQACTGEWSVGEMIDSLISHYPEASADMKNDVFRTLDLLMEEGVIDIPAPSEHHAH